MSVPSSKRAGFSACRRRITIIEYLYVVIQDNNFIRGPSERHRDM